MIIEAHDACSDYLALAELREAIAEASQEVNKTINFSVCINRYPPRQIVLAITDPITTADAALVIAKIQGKSLRLPIRFIEMEINCVPTLFSFPHLDNLGETSKFNPRKYQSGQNWQLSLAGVDLAAQN